MQTDDVKIGVYICECGINIAATVNVPEVTEYAKSLPNVTVSKYYKYMCSEPGQALIKDDIRELGLNRVVVASCSPRMHEPTFRAVVAEEGLNPYCFEMTNLREHCSWAHTDTPPEATKKAKDLIRMAVAKARLLQPLEKKEVPVTQRALVIGGGIAGIQAALEIADNGFKVYIVEKSPSIGGRMAQLDKTFPTLDCSACILTPKMVDVARHPNIELLTYAEVTGVDGYIGNFKVKVRKHTRYVDMEKCIGCGRCADACRLKGRILNEFDLGLGRRGAIYIPFPQAVPLKYTIDKERCLYLTKGKCGKSPRCKDACDAEAINFELQDEDIELNVGTIIVATGYDIFDARQKPEYGYGKYDNVITGLELERLCSSSGPTGGKIQINGNAPPRNVVFIQCVGSRDREGNQYCSRVCCMYTAKQAHLIRERLPDAEIVVYYTDVRAFGKGFEEFYKRVEAEGVTYRRRELDDKIEVIESNGKLIVRAAHYPDTPADLVVLATAIVPRKDIKDLATLLKIPQGPDGFLLEAHPKLRPLDTVTRGIFVAGCCQSPKDIPDAVAQASGAAVKATIPLAQGKVELEPTISFVIDENCDGCAYCIDPCPFSAITLIEYKRLGEIKKTVEVMDALCQGCGVCQATCPKRGIIVQGFTLEQLTAQVTAAIESLT